MPTTGGGPDTGPKTIMRPQGGEAVSEPAPQLHQAPPPSEVPDWSDGEAMPLIIIDNSSEMPAPTKTIEGLLIDSDEMLPLSHEMNSSGDQGVLSAPLSPNRVRKGYSQDMPAEGSLFDVSRHSGISHATGGGQFAASRYDRAPASKLRRFQ